MFLVFGLTGCPASGEDVQPPRDAIFFPTGLALDPAETAMFVANANSNLEYDSGSVVVAGLDAIDALVDTWLGDQVPAGCVQDQTLAHIVQCDESEVIDAGASVRIGNFSTDIAVQELADNSLRLFLPVRGDPSITWIDYDPGAGLACGGSGSFPACDDSHRLTNYLDDLDLPGLITEPFSIFVDSGNGYAVVTHLSQAAVSLVDAPVDGGAPVLSDVIAGVFAAEGSLRAAVDVAGRMPGMPEDLLYVTSRTESRVQMLYVRRQGNRPRLVASEYFFLEQVFPSDDGRGIAFSDDGGRAYIVNRDPPMLQIIDTSLGDDGFPKNSLESSVEICRDASQVVIADVGRGERAYVSCFPASQIWVINPERAEVEAIADVGRGPSAIAVSETRQKLYAANFLEDTLAVVDLEPGSATENLMVLRLGTPRQNEEEQ